MTICTPTAIPDDIGRQRSDGRIPGSRARSLVPKSHRHTTACRYLDVNEISEYTRISGREIRRLCETQSTSGFPAVRFHHGGKWKARICELQAWLDDRAERIRLGQLV